MILQQPLVSLIAAMAENGTIGRENSLPWRLADDLKRFKALTLGKPLLMGRKTYESIGRPLPERANLVLTRDRDWRAEGVIVVRSLGQALSYARDAEELVAIGGAEIYRLLMPFARRIYLTLVHAEIAGDRFFPDLDPTQWADVECHSHPADERNAYPFTFVTLERKSEPQAPASD
ncbi:MAG: dihydrofolate reductase [Steroidobacteraceae bacterium]